MRTIVIGLGNTILTDDGVGIYAARELKKHVLEQDIEIAEASLAGMRLLEIVNGYDRLIIVDSIKTENGTPGQIYRLEPDKMNMPMRLSSLHDTDLLSALKLGEKLGYSMPADVIIIAIEVADNTLISEHLTSEVEAAFPILIEAVIKEIKRCHAMS